MSDYSLYGVLGNPVYHSRSPELFKECLRISNLRGSYLRLAVDSVEEGITLAKQLGVCALNVTAPFKEEAFNLVPNDSRTGSINCIDVSNSVGFSTDEAGIIESLPVVGGKNVVVIGAGGAARSAIWATLSAGGKVSVRNRTYSKAVNLARQFGITVATDQDISDAEILINTTPGMVIPETLLKKTQLALDAIYGTETPFSKAVREKGLDFIPGTEWLIHQGLSAFKQFTGNTVNASEVRDAVLKRRAVKRLFLVGMMGSGKSTLGPILAERLGWEFFELDELIVRRAEKTIPQIFSEHGETFFRELEREELLKCSDIPNAVISTGGGAVVQNSDLLTQRGETIWLYSPLSVLSHRTAIAERPLLSGSVDPDARLASIWQERRTKYADVASLVIQTSEKDPAELARRLSEEIHKAGIC